MLKTWKRIVAIVIAITSLFLSTKPVNAANYAIKNNGLNGIYIDINGSPYTSTEKRMASLKRACTWFVSARVKELTGVYPEINGGQWWWKQSNTANGYYGFKAISGAAPTGKAVACYTNHVSIVEAYDGKMYTISEGGNGVAGKASEKYCQITTRTLSQIKNLGGSSGRFLGFVSLGKPFPQSDTEPPVITNAMAHDITETGFDVSCIASDNVDIDRVCFPTWTTRNGQDDLIWHQGKYEGGRWKCHIDISQHSGEKGMYITHIYAYDKAGNEAILDMGEYQIGAYAKDIDLNNTTLQLSVGETVALQASISPADAVDKTVIWTSSDERIVTVSDGGEIKAVGKGTAIVTARLKIGLIGGKNTAECTVNVVDKPEPNDSNSTPSADIVEVDMPQGTEESPEKRNYSNDNSIKEKSDDTALSTPEKSQNQSDLSASGKNKPVECNNSSCPTDTSTDAASEPICERETKEVKSKTTYAKDICLDECTLQMNTGDVKNLNATIYPSNATENTVYWSSSDESVAIVENGAVKAVGEGTALITASLSHAFADGNWFETCTVYVTAANTPCNNVTEYTGSPDENMGNKLQEGKYKAPGITFLETVRCEGDNIVLTYGDREQVYTPCGAGEYQYYADECLYTITVTSSTSYTYIIRDAKTNARKMRLYYNYCG